MRERLIIQGVVFYLRDRLIELPRELDAEDEVLAASRADRVMRDLKVLPSLQANASIQHLSKRHHHGQDGERGSAHRLVLPERHIAVEVFALGQRPIAGQAVLRDRVETLAPCQVPAGLERRDGASIPGVAE